MQSTITVAQQKAAVLFPVFDSLHHTPETISQLELQMILTLHARREKLERDIATAESGIKARLEAGAIIEPGDHFAELKEHSRRSVPWKEVSARLAGRLGYDPDVYCSRVLAATKPTKSVSLEVQ